MSKNQDYKEYISSAIITIAIFGFGVYLSHWFLPHYDMLTFETTSKICDKSISDYKQSSPSIGISMMPTIRPSSTILYVDYDSSMQLVEGDIIYTDNFGHRVISVYEDYVVTKGDNNKVIDEPTPLSEIKYVVCGVLY